MAELKQFFFANNQRNEDINIASYEKQAIAWVENYISTDLLNAQYVLSVDARDISKDPITLRGAYGKQFFNGEYAIDLKVNKVNAIDKVVVLTQDGQPIFTDLANLIQNIGGSIPEADDDNIVILDATKDYLFDNVMNRVVMPENSFAYSLNIKLTNGFNVLFTAGFGATADDIPEDIKGAVKTLAFGFYANRSLSPQGIETLQFAKEQATEVLKNHMVIRL